MSGDGIDVAGLTETSVRWGEFRCGFGVTGSAVLGMSYAVVDAAQPSTPGVLWRVPC
jgi:hypothetical protein